MSDEKLMNDVAEAETGYLEVYIRFNDDFDKDYCFQVKSSDTFKDLNRIFTGLPIALRPSIFHLRIPVGYRVCNSPGYLTEDGSLLFDYDTDKKKFLKNVGLNSRISDECWPGQLIVPTWELKTFWFYSFLSFLIVWLYTDLPDYISPTPGLCFTNQVSYGLIKLARSFGQDRIASAIINDVLEPVSVPVQFLFFFLHILKCLMVFMILWTGAFNPVGARIPFVTNKVKTLLDITRDELLAIGWTGSRRASPDEYKDFYREYKIKEHGGLVPAHKAGVFEKLKKLGVFLGEGEGFNTPLDNKSVVSVKDLINKKDVKFTLGYEYLALLGEFFEKYSDENENVKIQDLVKQYRRYGILHSSETIKKIVDNRKERGDTFPETK